MQTTEFGRLTEINVRDLWPHEQYDFSNWLKASRILYSIPGLNFDNHSNYQQLMNEIIDKVMQMKKVFSNYI